MIDIKENSVFGWILECVSVVLKIATPFSAIAFFVFLFNGGFTKDTFICLLLFILGLYCFYFHNKDKDIIGRENQIKYLRENAEKEIEHNRSVMEREKSKADTYCAQKRCETDDYAAKKRVEIDAYVNSKKSSVDDYCAKKRIEIDEYKAKRQEEINAYKKRKQEEIDAYKEKTQEELDDYKEEIEEEIEDWKFGDNTLNYLRNCEFEEYKNKFGIIDEKRLVKAIKSEFPFTYTASMSADYEAALFEKEEKRLRWKSPPAKTSADVVNDIKKKFRKSQSECKVMLYKYEFLLSTFPELRKYVEDEKGLLSLAEANGYDDFTENYDRTQDYLSDEEYRQLSVAQRNQLALNRYNSRPKSNWVVGTEYEMYCEHLLRKEGFVTIDYGVRKRLNDLGRDIIAKKDTSTYIIQCKRWSATKEIHENVICQLYGTSIEYNMQVNRDQQNPTLFDEEVIPLLITTAKLSETAQAFADKLGVVVKIEQMGTYPQIKCNINNKNEKIYHLPFDQQYYNTHIDKMDEMYAWTVDEAEKKGFRRAFKWGGDGK